jgi:hypothetical protein
LTLGNTLSIVGRLEESFGAFARAFDALEHAPHPLFEALALLGYANTAHLAGDNIEAARAAGKALLEMHDRNMSLGVTYTKFVDELIERIKRQLGDEHFEAAWVAGRQMTIGDFRTNLAAQM